MGLIEMRGYCNVVKCSWVKFEWENLSIARCSEEE